MNKIFVYGSLRYGGRLNHIMKRYARFLRQAKTKKEFSLISLGAFPALISGGNTEVVGEIYEMTDQVLAYLDQIEQHPDGYTRTKIKLSDNSLVEAYLFNHEVDGCEEIASGDWIQFDQNNSNIEL